MVKTAGFKNDRRIAEAWIPSRFDNKDNNNEIFGGNAVFREIMQQPDGTLDTRFPPEMIPKTGSELALKIKPDLQSTSINANSILISSPNGVGSSY